MSFARNKYTNIAEISSVSPRLKTVRATVNSFMHSFLWQLTRLHHHGCPAVRPTSSWIGYVLFGMPPRKLLESLLATRMSFQSTVQRQCICISWTSWRLDLPAVTSWTQSQDSMNSSSTEVWTTSCCRWQRLLCHQVTSWQSVDSGAWVCLGGWWHCSGAWSTL